MMRQVLGLLAAFGCAAGAAPTPGPEAVADPVAEDTTEVAGAANGWRVRCDRQATVTVYVDNRSSTDVSVAFGPYRPLRSVLGFSQTKYRVSRHDLRSDIRLRIERGGLNVRSTPPIPTEEVVCNDATLIIGPRPRYSFFYGDLFLTRAWEGGEEKGDGDGNRSFHK
ncbi:MAG TPA: hypothetical protein VGA22_10900 [Gemmatimonadales bacterium]|jgi:hypothetical protein